MSTTTANPTTAGAPERGPARKAAVNPIVAILRPLASLQFTVFLFVLSLLLIFFGTLAQMNSGIWTVVDKYFWSYFVWVDFQLLVQFGQVFFGFPHDWKVSGAFPFIGGKLLGFVMLFNLLAAHALRFKLTWKRAGIWTLHFGLILLFIGEVGTRGWQVEQRMKIDEGRSSSYAFDTRNYELAFTDTSAPDADRVTVIPGSLLQEAVRDEKRITHPELPVDVEVTEYMVNSGLADPKAGENRATAGLGVDTAAAPKAEVTGVDMTQNIDLPSAYVKLYKKGTDESVGSYLVSLWFTHPNLKDHPKQAVPVDGKEYDLALRFTRYYKPFEMHLIDFQFDRYIGTEKAKNYSSHIRIVDPERGEDREVLISMNEPLRYRGETFYQSSFDPETERTTELQVVRNPVWWMPYVACVLVTLGMLVHFGFFLVRFLARTLSPTPTGAVVAPGKSVAVMRVRPSVRELAIPWAAFAVLVLLYGGGYLARQTPKAKLDLREVARLPVVEGGRVKPLDSVARVYLRMIMHTEQFRDTNDKLRPAVQWYMDVATSTATGSGGAADYDVFRVENDQVANLLGLKRREGLRYSLKEIIGDEKKYTALREAAAQANKVKEKERDLFQAKVLELWKHVGIYHEFWQGEAPLLLPPTDGKEWRPVGSPERTAEEMARNADAQVIEKILGFVPKTRQELFEAVQKLPRAEQEMLLSKIEEARAVAKTTFLSHIRESDKPAAAWQDVLAAYRTGDQAKLDAAVKAYREQIDPAISDGDRSRARFEVFLNEAAPFFHTTVVYVGVILLCLAGWVSLVINPGLGEGFRRTAFWVLVATFLLHGFSLFSRMYLMDRPLVFVTNLYSSAVFIGWAAVGLGLIIEWVFRIGVGNLIAAVIGFLTSMVAHWLAASGDTLEMMQAVLDTNFWLATHVTTVTLGYSATYVAGFVGLLYVLLGVFTPMLRNQIPLGTGPTAKPTSVGTVIGMILYGTICLAALLSFVGTVLGGIWADQSWGRFWGWDPKENGAVLIVVWNALILHARWAGLVKDRGVAVLAILGCMITTWSWFGTNQLGVGLHAYGFSNTLAAVCVSLWGVCAFASALGLVPTRFWASYAGLPVARPTGRA
ncbi:MAG TPA: cytochrome c biogenesis protein CcsA [Fimbriiglobus sp.]|nr:cytochrome c biogenesis protein CcsA [Fimbriiglobus sp.]